MKNKKRFFISILIFSFLLFGIFLAVVGIQYSRNRSGFNADNAMQDVEYQISLGPRTPGSRAHSMTGFWISSILTEAGWEVEIQSGIFGGHEVQNIIARRGTGERWIILGAHYDSRFLADRDSDPSRQLLPVPGANDGASGVGVLLELARSLPQNLDQQIWLVFFDAEDQGHIRDWDWILGSQYFVSQLNGAPDAVVVIDMIGDADLNISIEQNSDAQLVTDIWQIAHQLGYQDQFLDQTGSSILDDHIPFIRAGIPAIDIIDFTYPYWHTTEDTLDKLSIGSLQAVGETLFNWILLHE